jgi:hypothetical protein
LNGTNIKKSEWKVSQKLFIDPQTNTYDTQLIEWLRPEHSDRLYTYLARTSPLSAAAAKAAPAPAPTPVSAMNAHTIVATEMNGDTKHNQ